MANTTVSIEEHSAFVDIQDSSGKVVRYFPINRIIDVIGAKELSDAQRDVLKRLMANPYIAGTNAKGEPAMYRLEVSNGSLYLSDEIDVTNNSSASATEFTNYKNMLAKLFQ